MKNSMVFRVVVALVVVLALLGGGYAFMASREAGLREQQVEKLLADARDQRDSLDNPSEAFVKLKEANRLDPDSWEILYEMGVTCLALEQAKDATGALDRAAELAPASAIPKVSLKLGLAYRDRFIVTGERADFRRAVFAFDSVRTDPALEPEALFHLGILHLRLQRKKDLSEADFPMALEVFEELQKSYPDSEHREQVDQLLKLIRAKI